MKEEAQLPSDRGNTKKKQQIFCSGSWRISVALCKPEPEGSGRLKVDSNEVHI